MFFESLVLIGWCLWVQCLFNGTYCFSDFFSFCVIISFIKFTQRTFLLIISTIFIKNFQNFDDRNFSQKHNICKSLVVVGWYLWAPCVFNWTYCFWQLRVFFPENAFLLISYDKCLNRTYPKFLNLRDAQNAVWSRYVKTALLKSHQQLQKESWSDACIQLKGCHIERLPLWGEHSLLKTLKCFFLFSV